MRKSKKVGGQGPLPASYFGQGAPSAPAGGDLLPYRAGAGPFDLGRLAGGEPTVIRPAIGGFVPSVGEPFVAAAGKYIVPLALFAGYKLMGRKGPKTRRSQHSKRRRG